jgi:hypothetical protein
MKLKEYYDIIISKYNSGDFTLKKGKHLNYDPIINEKEFPLYALNYLIFEYLKDNKDDRWKLLLDFILVPGGVNQVGCDIDFTKVDFEEFFYFMLSIKN